MTGYWVRDLLRVWHKAVDELVESKVAQPVHGVPQYAVRCLSLEIDVDRIGIPGAGAVVCTSCDEIVQREEKKK